MDERGVYISSELGPNAENTWLSLISLFWPGKKVKFPFPIDIKSSHDFVEKLLKSGEFKPLIDREYPLEELRKAYQYVKSEQKVGNVILKVR